MLQEFIADRLDHEQSAASVAAHIHQDELSVFICTEIDEISISFVDSYIFI